MKKTHAAFVLDRSGSMYHLTKEMGGMFKDQVKILQKEASDDHEITLSFVSFASDIKEHFWKRDVRELSGDLDGYNPDGGTALYDGVGYTVEKLTDLDDPDEDDTAFVIVVLSDGGENYSRNFDHNRISEIIKGKTARGNWTFAYLGGGRDLTESMKSHGISGQNVVAFNPGNLRSVKALNAVAGSGLACYAAARSAGELSVDEMYASNDVMDPADIAKLDTNKNK